MEITTEKSDKGVLVNGSVQGCGVKGQFKKVLVQKLMAEAKAKAQENKSCSNATPVIATINGKPIKTNLRKAEATIIAEANKVR